MATVITILNNYCWPHPYELAFLKMSSRLKVWVQLLLVLI